MALKCDSTKIRIFREKMRIPQPATPYTAEQLMQLLSADHPNIKKRSASLFTVKKNKAIGAEVYCGKETIIIKGSWASPTARFLFYLSLILLGIILPVIIYAVFFLPPMKRFKKEVANRIESLT